MPPRCPSLHPRQDNPELHLSRDYPSKSKMSAQIQTAFTATSRTKTSNFVRLNDGTLRITAKWQPRNFDELTEDSGKWEYAATDLIHYMFICRWMPDQTGLLPRIPSIPSLELSPDNLLQYIVAPRITKLSSVKVFIFSFWITLATGHNQWINNPDTKSIMAHYNVEANGSNSSSDSGDTIPTVGYSFFKHPKCAHCMYYLIQLRKQLPAETPFFDIGFRQAKTSHIFR